MKLKMNIPIHFELSELDGMNNAFAKINKLLTKLIRKVQAKWAK